MSVMSAKTLSSTIKTVKGARAKLDEQIQECLISCAFYAMKDGNITPFNQLLDAVGRSTRIKGLTLWAETCGAPVLIRDGQFTYNKTAGKALDVTSEEDFAEYEEEMRMMPKWYDIVPAEKAESIFDTPKYLEGVYKKLEKEGQKDVADVLRKAIARANFEIKEVEV
jgi:hypothetical protein